MGIVAIFILFAGIHAALPIAAETHVVSAAVQRTLLMSCVQLLQFPVAELFFMKILFGMICVTSAMVCLHACPQQIDDNQQVLNPSFDIRWPYPVVSICVFIFVVIPYTVITFVVLYHNCSEDCESCSFEYKDMVDESEQEQPGSTKQEQSPISPTAAAAATAIQYEPGPQISPSLSCCEYVHREKLGGWHGGGGEAQAKRQYLELRAILGQWLKEFQALDGRLLQGGEQCAVGSMMTNLVTALEQAYEKMGRGFWIGNQAVWCCTACNPTQEDRLASSCRDLMNELREPSSDSWLDKAHGTLVGQHNVSPAMSAEMIARTLQEVIAECERMAAQRIEARSFLSKYAIWFWRFDGAHWFAEVVLYCHKLSFALVAGLLQKHVTMQAIAGFGVNVAFWAFLTIARPFNERARWAVEVVAQGLFTVAIGIIMFHVLEVDMSGMDVGATVNGLTLTGIMIKLAYMFYKAIFSTIRKFCPKACPKSEKKTDTEESLESMPNSIAEFDMEMASDSVPKLDKLPTHQL